MNKQHKNIIGILLTIGVIVLLSYKPLAKTFSELLQQNELNQYSQPIADCLKEKEAELGDRKVLGLEYGCAIEVAATIYQEDPEKAIRLCEKYSPLPTIPDYPTSGQINKEACKNSIEERTERLRQSRE